MLIKALIADDDMDAHQLMFDVLEINFRDVKIERALTLGSFWEKIAAETGAGSDAQLWHLIFISLDYIKEEPEGFVDRLKAANPDALSKVILVGYEQDFRACGEDIKELPFLAKPFSLDRFEDMVKSVHGA